MTTKKNTFIGIALLGIFIVISSFGNEISAQESDQLVLYPDESSDAKVNESDGAVKHDAAIDKVHIASYDKNDKLVTYSVQRQWIYGRNKQTAGHQSGEIDSGTSLRLQEDKDTKGVGDNDTPDKMPHGNTVDEAVTSNHGSNIDWHLPTIEELYALTDFNSYIPGVYDGTDISGMNPFLNKAIFDYADGDTNECLIDTRYVYNNYFASIASDYHLMDNGDDTISDSTHDLTRSHIDSDSASSRKNALAWEEEKNDDDPANKEWILPDTRKLKNILDFSLFPDATGSASCDTMFNATSYNQLDSAYHVKIFSKIFTIDTQGNIKCITGKILNLLL